MYKVGSSCKKTAQKIFRGELVNCTITDKFSLNTVAIWRG